MTTFSNNHLQSKRFRSRGGVIAVIVSFLLGFVFAFVAVAGTVYYLTASITVKQGIEKIGDLTGTSINYTDYISEEYAEKTLLNLIKDDVSGLIKKANDKTLTLNDLDEISPFVGTQAEKLTETLKNDYGLTLSSDELMQTSVSGIGDYLRTNIRQADLGSLLSAPKVGAMKEGTGNYDLLMAICYGDPSHYDVIDGTVVMKEGYPSTTIGDLMDDAKNAVAKAPLDKVLGVEADSDVIMISLCYGNEYEITDGKIELPEGKTSSTLGQLMDNPSELLEPIELGAVMKLDGNSDYTSLAIAYGKRGTDYEIDEKTNKIIPVEGGKAPTLLRDVTGENTPFFDDLRSTLTLKDLIVIGENSSGIAQALKDKTLKELDNDEEMKKLTIGEITNIDESSSKILIALKDKTIGDLNKQETIDNLKLGEIMNIDNSSSKLIIALQDKTVADLQKQETIDNLKLGEIMNIDNSSPKLLVALQDEKIGNLNSQETIDNLKLGEIMNIDNSSPRIIQKMADWTIADMSGSGTKNIEKDLTLTDILGEEAMTGNILKNLTDSTIESLATDINDLTIQDVMSDEIYVDPTAEVKVLKGPWKYLLTDKGTGKEGVYKITDMSKMVDNMTYNVQKATINDLRKDGILAAEESFCEQVILYKYKIKYTVSAIEGEKLIFSIREEDRYKNEDGSEKTKIGELTILEMIEYLNTVLDALRTSQN